MKNLNNKDLTTIATDLAYYICLHYDDVAYTSACKIWCLQKTPLGLCSNRLFDDSRD